MIELTLAGIAAATGGVVHGPPDLVVSGAAYLDSRKPVPGGLFVALAGERTDGHSYAAGAHAVLGSRPTAAPTVVVRDPVVGLGRLGRRIVDEVRPTVLALTGSHGKTGTKELLAALLPGAVATAGNLNNELGVPLTCLRLTEADDQLVLEMGARGVGHLAWLCEIAPPTVAAVLGVGSAHVGEFGSPGLVAAAKGELVEALPVDGVAVLNADDARVAAMASRTCARVVTFGSTGDVSWRGLRLDRLGRASFELTWADRSAAVSLRVLGAHQAGNAAAAAAMALSVGEPLGPVAERLSSVPPAPHRMEPRHRDDGLLVLDDTYNASPDTVRAALRTLVEIGRHRTGRPIAVLGDMRELGAWTDAAHRAVRQCAHRLGVEVVPAGDSVAAAVAWLDRHARPDDVVLVKGSRAAGLERVVEEVMN